jgi:hypothetical protein
MTPHVGLRFNVIHNSHRAEGLSEGLKPALDPGLAIAYATAFGDYVPSGRTGMIFP